MVGTRSRASRRRLSDHDLRCSASDRRWFPARPAQHVHRRGNNGKGRRQSALASAHGRRMSAPLLVFLPSALTRVPIVAALPHQIKGFQGLSMNWRFTGCIFRGPAAPMRRRTRRNVSTIGAGAPDMPSGRADADQAGARPYRFYDETLEICGNLPLPFPRGFQSRLSGKISCAE